ncbi:MAG: type II toxin-antitoxin system VapC family toxin [Nitrospira sp. CG24B]|nr:MAG: type II toxin-antitoxin system VapC family toxin [Nitrospira sp. CG24B]
MRQTRWAYFDASVLVKRYVKEQGSATARRLLQQYRFLSSAVAPVEVLSLVNRRRTLGELTQRDCLAIRSRLRKDHSYWELVEVSEVVLHQAEELAQRTGLRTLDAVHLASLLTFQAASGLIVPFITADVRQRKVAETMALNLIWVD